MVGLREWISTRVAVFLTALVLLAGSVSFVLLWQEKSRQDALQSIADRASALIEAVSAMVEENATSISLGPDGTLELPELAAGQAYSLTLYRSYVVAGLDGRRAFAVLRTPIHLWEPRAGQYTASSVADLDALYPSITLKSSGSALVSRRFITIDGTTTLETFAFL